MLVNAVGQRHNINFKAHVDLGRARQILPKCSNEFLENLYVDTKNIDSFYGKGDYSWNERTIVNLKNGKAYEVSNAVDSIEGLIDEVTRRFVSLGRARQISPKGCSNEVLEGLYVDTKNIDSFYGKGDYSWNERTIVNLKNGKAYEVSNAVDSIEGLIDEVTRRFVDLGRARQISPKVSNEVLEGLYVDIKNIDSFHSEGDYPWNERTIVNLKNGKAYEVTNAVDKLEGLIDEAKGIRPRKKETYYGGFY